jgi:hypothetical protein
LWVFPENSSHNGTHYFPFILGQVKANIYLTNTPCDSLDLWGRPHRKLVSVLDIVREHLEVYTEAAFGLGLASRFQNEPLTSEFVGSLAPKILRVAEQCEILNLPCTLDSARLILNLFQHPERWQTEQTRMTFQHLVLEMASRLDLELASRIFFRLQEGRPRYFENPTIGWAEVLNRFDCLRDVEEANRCFALSRHPAAVFHSVQIVEIGLIELGRFLKVKDPISGWTAVCKALAAVIDKKHERRTRFEKKHFQFIEQINGLMQAIKNAWRNKISHASGRLVLMTSEFAPDVAEEILFSTRALMRRLAEELPPKSVS